MTTRIAIMGDNFMLPAFFEAELANICVEALDIRSTVYPFPEVPLIAVGNEVENTENLREFLGKTEDVVNFVDDAEVLITHVAPVSAQVIKSLPNLKLIVVCRGGPVNVDVAYAREAGIRTVNTPGRNASAVAQFTVGAIIAHSRNILEGHIGLRSGEWRREYYRADKVGMELQEMTIGLIGYGEIGRRIIDLLQPFGSRILVHDPFADLTPEHIGRGVHTVELDPLLNESHVVSLQAKFTEDTRHMINKSTLAKMREDALLINTARGAMVVQSELVDALTKGQIGGAVLDTFLEEPIDHNDPLLKLENVTLTPHIAGASRYSIVKTAQMAAEEIRRYQAGEPPVNLC